ncbi:hypothetical protein AVEN_255938-1 [Araneus ventricosus]|uniref:DUF4817 domain-containing protein n=1 Tax=Araneus ventricosus TaxID=182803 RepID=A0A4Y2KNH0_ARAVE|nr:hypothetical protein AVEN_255938-1 [Araneus ventricosus]
MDSLELKIFIEGYFTVRRKERVYSGVTPGLIIEQCLMKGMVVEGVVKEFRRMKQIRKGPMSSCALRKMIQKFETTGQLEILPGRGRKKIPSSNVEDVATAVVEVSSQSLYGCVSVPVVSVY